MDGVGDVLLLRLALEHEGIEAVHRIEQAQDFHIRVDLFLDFRRRIILRDLERQIAVKAVRVEVQRFTAVIPIVDVVWKIHDGRDDDGLARGRKRGLEALQYDRIVHDPRLEQQPYRVVRRNCTADFMAIERHRTA